MSRIVRVKTERRLRIERSGKYLISLFLASSLFMFRCKEFWIITLVIILIVYILGKSKHLTLMVVALTRCEGHFVVYDASRRATFQPKKCVCKSFSIITVEMNIQNRVKVWIKQNISIISYHINRKIGNSNPNYGLIQHDSEIISSSMSRDV